MTDAASACAPAWRILKGLPLALLSRPLLLVARRDRCFLLRSHSPACVHASRSPADTQPDTARRQHRHSQLERPRSAGEISALGDRRHRNSVPAAKSSSSTTAPTDGSAEFVLENVSRRCGCSRSTKIWASAADRTPDFEHARNDIVVLLNSDMRVERDFLAPLLDGFTDEKVFAVSCQIFFSDPAKLREETGLTEGWWQQGALRVRHRIEPAIRDLYPCFYGGGGSCAFDRRKFLELGGFDELLAPFYLEDTDLGYLAWKRGWKVLYQPGQRGLSRTSRHHRKPLQRRLHSNRPQEEFPAVHLEKHPRVAPSGRAFLSSPGPVRC